MPVSKGKGRLAPGPPLSSNGSESELDCKREASSSPEALALDCIAPFQAAPRPLRIKMSRTADSAPSLPRMEGQMQEAGTTTTVPQSSEVEDALIKIIALSSPREDLVQRASQKLITNALAPLGLNGNDDILLHSIYVVELLIARVREVTPLTEHDAEITSMFWQLWHEDKLKRLTLDIDRRVLRPKIMDDLLGAMIERPAMPALRSLVTLVRARLSAHETDCTQAGEEHAAGSREPDNHAHSQQEIAAKPQQRKRKQARSDAGDSHALDEFESTIDASERLERMKERIADVKTLFMFHFLQSSVSPALAQQFLDNRLIYPTAAKSVNAAHSTFDDVTKEAKKGWKEMLDRLHEGDMRALELEHAADLLMTPLKKKRRTGHGPQVDDVATSEGVEHGIASTLGTPAHLPSDSGDSGYRSGQWTSSFRNTAAQKSMQISRKLEPRFIKYETVASPKSTVLIRKRSINSMPQHAIEKVCRDTFGPEIPALSSHWLSPHLLVMRFADVRAANEALAKKVKCRDSIVKSEAYPEKPPQAFFFTIKTGPTLVCGTEIYTKLQDAAKKIRFHVLRQRGSKANGALWVVIYEKPPGHLRFSLPMLARSANKDVMVHFEPLRLVGACLACARHHTTTDCNTLVALGTVGRGIEADFSAHLPQVPAFV